MDGGTGVGGYFNHARKLIYIHACMHAHALPPLPPLSFVSPLAHLLLQLPAQVGQFLGEGRARVFQRVRADGGVFDVYMYMRVWI